MSACRPTPNHSVSLISKLHSWAAKNFKEEHGNTELEMGKQTSHG